MPEKNYEPKKTAAKPQAHNSTKNDSPSTETASSAQGHNAQAWTLESAKSYYLATVMGNDGNPLKLVGDIPTKTQTAKHVNIE